MKTTVVFVIAITQSLALGRDDAAWGTYRPIPYVGLRSKSENSPLIGLLWYKPSLMDGDLLRHQCDNEDNMKRYGWNKHDGKSYGK